MKALVATLILTAVSALALAGEGSLSVTILDSRTKAIQDKADLLFERGNFERALFIYKSDLAPVGDKYAQYMVGFMYENGMGVDADPVIASAWYRIAASGRGSDKFAEAAEDSVRLMDESDRQASDRAYLELRQRYSDVAVMFRQVEKDYEVLMAVQTGTRIPGGSRSIVSTGPGASEVDRNAVERSLNRGLAYLAETLGNPAYNLPYTEVDLKALERDVENYVSRLD